MTASTATTAFLPPLPALSSSPFTPTRARFRPSPRTPRLKTRPRRLHPSLSPARRSSIIPTTSCASTDDSLVAPPATAFTFAVGHSKKDDVFDCVKEALLRAGATFTRQNVPASVVFLFLRSSFTDSSDEPMSRVVPLVRKTLAMSRVWDQNTLVYGCTTSHYIAPEGDATATVALVHFPENTTISTFYIENENTVDLDWMQSKWHDFVGMPFNPQSPTDPVPTPQTNILLLQHPEFERMEDVLSSLDFAYPGIRILGAAAGKTNPLHDAYLFDSDGVKTSGVLGLAVSSPDLQVDVTVAQGARGVGPLLEVVKVRDGSEITRLKEVNTPGLTEAAPMILLDMWGKTDLITPEDREYARKYLLFGVEVQTIADLAFSSVQDSSKATDADKKKEAQKPIEMVIRKVIGFNEGTGALAIEGGDVRLGSRVQFQIRDEEAARAELSSVFNRLMLEGSSKAMDGMSLMGALLMVDSERGVNLFGDAAPDLDRQMYIERFPVPLAILTSDRQIGPLPSGGLFGAAGNTFCLSASALYVSFYGRTAKPTTADEEGS